MPIFEITNTCFTKQDEKQPSEGGSLPAIVAETVVWFVLCFMLLFNNSLIKSWFIL